MDAQYRMAPLNRERIDISGLKEEQFRQSAVMIVFCLDENNAFYIPLIERFEYAGAHSAQISLPGGKRDPLDVSLEQTALRECYEEIGIRENIRVAGQLSKVFIPVSGFLVQPYVGVCMDKNPVFLPDAREVKKIINLRIDDFLDHTTIKKGTIHYKELEIETPYFSVEDRKVWGATAMILSELKEIVSAIF